MTPSIARHRTALNRTELSRPVRLAFEDGMINPQTAVFDYGCGRGNDLRLLREREVRCNGWDPAYFPQNERIPSGVVNLGYVINVIEDSAERAATLRQAWSLAQEVLVVSARLTVEQSFDNQTPHADGCLTRLGTFQKYYEQQELREWIDQALNVSSVPAAPGIFYVFRDSDARQSFVATRYRRRFSAPRQRRSEVLFEEHQDLLESLIEFVTARGRLPDESELVEAPLICKTLGSLKRAYGIIRRVTGNEEWSVIREERSQDLLLYLALLRFEGRPRFTRLSRDLQLDVKAFFSSYKQACSTADALLFSAGNTEMIDQACRNSPIGKVTPSALYVHASALFHLPPVLRVYEGCARAYIGTTEEANIIKLHRDSSQISYLSYPDFDKDPHPALASSLIVPLQTFKIKYRDYRNTQNPPILHRKETFVSADHPLYTKFARLTRQEEKWGLYEQPERIGTRDGWEQTLANRGVRLSGHRLVRKNNNHM